MIRLLKILKERNFQSSQIYWLQLKECLRFLKYWKKSTYTYQKT